MTTRAALIRLAYAVPAQRNTLLRMAREFATEDALKKYLKEHPNADPKKHSVKKDEDGGGSSDEEGSSDGGGSQLDPKSIGLVSIEGGSEIAELLDIQDLNNRFSDDTEASDSDIKEFEDHPAVKELSGVNLNVLAGDDGKLTRGELTRAMHVAAVLNQNLKGPPTVDFCKMNPPACEGNLGITRDNMPQIMDKPISKLLDAMDEGEYDKLLKKVEAAGDKPLSEVIKDEGKRDAFINRRKGLAAVAAGADPDDTPQQVWFKALNDAGIEINDDEIEVGQLIASQAEIKAGKSYGIARNYLESAEPDYSKMPKDEVKKLDKKLKDAGLDPDKLAELDDDEIAKVIPDRETRENYAAARGEGFHALPNLPILVARDPETGKVTVIDGHHRYAGLLLADPSKKMKVKVIETGIQDALNRSFDVPGVFRADINDNIVDSNAPLDLARQKGETWQQRNGKWYAKNSEGEKGTTGGPFDSEDAAKNFASGKKASLSRRDRDRLVRLASTLPKGNPTRRGILAGIRTHDTSIGAPMRRRAKFPKGKEMTIDEVAAVVGPEFKEMNENPPESVKKVRKEMEKDKKASLRRAARRHFAGRRYDYDEVIDFLTEDNSTPELERMWKKWSEMVEDLHDRWFEGWAEANAPELLDESIDYKELAWKAFGSVTGMGIGLWEGDFLGNEHDEAFEKVVNRDSKVSRFGHHLDDEISMAREYGDEESMRMASRRKMKGKKAALVRLAATLPKGHPDRRTLLAMVGKSARRLQGEPLYDRIKQIVDEKQYARINGVDVDMTTANLLVQVADKLNPTNRNRFLALDIPKMVELAWRVAR